MIKDKKEEDQIRADIQLCKTNVKTAISKLQEISKKIGEQAMMLNLYKMG